MATFTSNAFISWVKCNCDTLYSQVLTLDVHTESIAANPTNQVFGHVVALSGVQSQLVIVAWPG